MKDIKIGENLVCLRRKKRITQEQLADFIGVTKASVSKWENSLSYPDIETLPRLAAFFDVSLDDLMGYEPEITQEQVLHLYAELKKEFAAQPFEVGMEHSRSLIKQYYHCHPLLFQICILWMNHYYMGTAEQQKRVLEDVCRLAARIRMESADMDMQNGALVIRATAQLLLENPDAVIEELEEVQRSFGSLTEISSLLIRAYQMKKDYGEAREKVQRSIYSDLLRMVSDSTLYLNLEETQEQEYEETVRRVLELMKIYSFESLHPNNAAGFFYHAAVGYALREKDAEAVAMLRRYWEAVKKLLAEEQIRLHGDDYFTEIEKWYEGVNLVAPREISLVKESVLQSAAHPAFAKLEANKEFQRIRQEIEWYVQENGLNT